MLRHWKTTAITAPLTLAALALGGYAYTRFQAVVPLGTHAAPSYHLANGIEVTPTVNPQDETAQLLEIKSWDFDITQPDASKPFYISFALYGNAKFVKTINGGTARFPDPSGTPKKEPITTHVSLAFLPLGGSIYDAHELKYRMTIETGGSGISGSMPNPVFKGKNLISDAQVASNDNAIMLLSTNRTSSTVSGKMACNNTNLALRITQIPPP